MNHKGGEPEGGEPGEGNLNPSHSYQFDQSHLCTLQDHRADPPGNEAKAHGKRGGGW